VYRPDRARKLRGGILRAMLPEERGGAPGTVNERSFLSAVVLADLR
jgi:hypothetical protein